MEDYLPYSLHSLDKREEREVLKILRSNNLTQGKTTEEFEERINEYIGSKYTVSVSNGTAALHIALMILSGGKKNNIVTTPLTYVATSNMVLATGNNLYFGDINKDTLLLDPFKLKDKRSYDGAIIVHYGGRPNNIEDWENFNGWIIEDSSHSFGSKRFYNGKWEVIGSNPYSLLSTFSLHASKVLTTGEGGLIVTNDYSIYREAKKLRDNGREEGEVYRIGFNYRLTDIQAAIGIVQLSKLGSFLEKRLDLARLYNLHLDKYNKYLEIPEIISGSYKSSLHLYVVRLRLENLRVDRDTILQELRSKGIGVQVHYKPIYRFKYYLNHYRKSIKDCQVMEKVYPTLLTLPLFYNMEEVDIFRVIRSIGEVIRKYKY